MDAPHLAQNFRSFSPIAPQAGQGLCSDSLTGGTGIGATTDASTVGTGSGDGVVDVVGALLATVGCLLSETPTTRDKMVANARTST